MKKEDEKHFELKIPYLRVVECVPGDSELLGNVLRRNPHVIFSKRISQTVLSHQSINQSVYKSIHPSPITSHSIN